MHSTLCPELIGRTEERAVLAHRLDEVAAGVGGVVVLVGDAGHGKSRLARGTAEAAVGRGLRTATGHATADGSPVPFRAVTEALLAAFRSVERPPAEALAGFAPHLGRLVPEWGSGSAESSTLLVGEAVVRLLRASGTGWVLVLEDLQWADDDTIAVVEFLAGALRTEAVLCLVTVRSGADGPAGRLRRRGAAVIDLGPLPATEIDAMAAACLGVGTVPDGVGPFLRTLAEGSPFLVEELLADLIATDVLVRDPGWTVRGALRPVVTRSVAESVGVGLRSMSADERRVLSAAALLGREFDWRLVAEVSGVDAVGEALRRAVEEQVLLVEGDGFRFRHALIRQAVVESLLPPERAALAARALAAVERAHPGFPRDRCELAASLAETAGDLDRAAELLVECGRRASDRGALAAAESTLTRATALDTSDDVRFRTERALVEVWVQIGAAPRALALAQALTTRMPADAGADDRLALLGLVATAALAAGDTGAAEAAVGEAGSVGAGSGGARARSAVVAAQVALAAGRTDEAAELARAGRDQAVTADVECDALWVLGRVAEDFDRKLVAFREAADVAGRAGLPVRALQAEHECAILTAVLGDPSDLVRVREAAQAAGAAATAASADLLLADLAFAALDHDTCLAAATRCVEAGRRFGHATLPVGLLWLAGAHALAGRDAEMEAALAEAAEVAPGDPRIAADALGRVRATRAQLRGDRAELAEVLDRSMEHVRVAPATGAVFSGRLLWAIVHSAADDDRGAAARAEVAAAGYLDAVPVLAAVRTWADAVAAGRAGRPGEAAAHHARGDALLTPGTRASGTVHLALLLVAEAALRDGWGDPVVWLREGEGFFFERGQERLARECRALLGAAGAPRPRRRSGAAPVPPALRALGVTEREHEVLVLVAAGGSNRDIADRLVLSVRTVEHHIASLLRRTGVRDRGRLAALVG